MTSALQHGGCLCGAVRFEIKGPLREVIYCHCEQCQRTSGHFVAASACASADLGFVNRQGLSWFDSSAQAQRGFCRLCGSSLFWRLQGRDAISVMAGALDRPTSLTASHHMFAERAGDYYALEDGLPHEPSAAACGDS